MADDREHAEGSVTSQQLRRSTRENKGIAPERYGYQQVGVPSSSGGEPRPPGHAPISSTPSGQPTQLLPTSGIESSFAGLSFSERRSPVRVGRSPGTSMASSSAQKALLAKELERVRIKEAFAQEKLKLEQERIRLESREKQEELQQQIEDLDETGSQYLGSQDGSINGDEREQLHDNEEQESKLNTTQVEPVVEDEFDPLKANPTLLRVDGADPKGNSNSQANILNDLFQACGLDLANISVKGDNPDPGADLSERGAFGDAHALQTKSQYRTTANVSIETLQDPEQSQHQHITSPVNPFAPNPGQRAWNPPLREALNAGQQDLDGLMLPMRTELVKSQRHPHDQRSVAPRDLDQPLITWNQDKTEYLMPGSRWLEPSKPLPMQSSFGTTKRFQPAPDRFGNRQHHWERAPVQVPTATQRKKVRVVEDLQGTGGAQGCESSIPTHSSVHPHPAVAGPTPLEQAFMQMAEGFGRLTSVTERLAAQPQRDESKTLMARQSMLRDLPFFSGEPEEWAQFKSSFDRTTKACHFSGDENLARLQKCLKGPAKEAVAPLMVSPLSVPTIMETLERQFGKPKMIIHRLGEKAKAVPSVKEDKWESWTAFTGSLNTLVASMTNLKCQTHYRNPVLMDEMVNKLPSTHRFKWAEHVYSLSREPNLDDLASWATRQADIMGNIILQSKPSDSKPKPKEILKPTKKPSETILTVEEKPAENKVPSPTETKSGKICPYCCKEAHWVFRCKVLKSDSVDVRWKVVKEKNLCFGCFSSDHGLRDCKTKRQCVKDGCEHFHNVRLHKSSTTKEEPEAPAPKVRERVSTVQAGVSKKRVLLKIVPVMLRGSKGETQVYALLDDGSSVTLIEQELADQLGMSGEVDPLRMGMAAGMSAADNKSQRVDLWVADGAGTQYYRITGARTITGLNLSPQSVDVPRIRKRWSHILDKGIESYENVRPQMLLGQDNYHLIAPREILEGPPNAPVLTRTKLGWVIHGNLMTFKRAGATEVVLTQVTDPENEEWQSLIRHYFSIEALGVKTTSPRISKDDARAMKILKETTCKADDRFQTGLLWREEAMILPESRTAALKRLVTTERRMARDQNFAKQYRAKIDHFLDQGYAQIVESQELSSAGPRLWYLPHFAVVNPRKPGKIRLVFDCAAKSNGTSLNDALLTGPDYLTSLPGNLFKFRSRNIAITGDIREMYPQIKIISEDQWSQCFLWRSDSTREPETYKMTSMTFGAKSSPCSAQYIKNVNAEAHATNFPEASKAIIQNHYMDNYIDSLDTEEETHVRVNEILHIHKQAGFVMCNWNSNSEEVIKRIPDELRSKGPTQWGLNADQPDERILGLQWDPTFDDFKYDLGFYKVRPDIISGAEIPTKRDVTSVVMAIFDPLGLVSHLTISGKVLIQEIWKSQLDWSDPIPEFLVGQWKEFLKSIELVKEVRVPRNYTKCQASVLNRQLHVFSDASKSAYATVAYFRTQFEDRVEVSLVMAKSRVVPLKPTTLTIPRLELEAALLSSRLAKTIVDGHDLSIDQVIFWSDSQVVLHWIQSQANRFEVFVANRLGQIEELTKSEQWRFVPTKLNSADIATRSKSSVDPQAWICGPSFLMEPEEVWPCQEMGPRPIEIMEIKKSERLNYQREVSRNELFTRYSRLSKLIRVTAWMLRVLRWKRGFNADPLSARELHDAQTRLEIWSQRESFPEYQAENSVEDPKGRLFNLHPFRDRKGLLRIKGRIKRSESVTYDVKHPIILDPSHPYTTLLILNFHLKAAHQGHETVLNNIRQRYWVLRGREAVRRVFKHCQVCKIVRAKPVPPAMGSLPEFRVTRQHRPFAVTGVDYFGPIEITVGRRHEKRWGVLFTCMTVRAVHVEVASTLSADSCIQAIRRFVARRGKPNKIWSDNGTNFKGASAEMQVALQELDHNRIRDATISEGIDWEFIPPHSPHMGGCWERLVGSVKRSLKAILKERYPHEETLRTFLCEAEAIVNKHPLTHVPIEAADDPALTPENFLLNHGLTAIADSSGPPGMFDDDEFRLRRQWRIGQRLADQFWKRWVREYLPILNKQGKWFKTAKPIKEGDIVVIAEDNAPRNQWERARIVKVHPGEDGVIRVATVRTASGSVYKRPVVKLCILDLEKSDDVSPSSGGRMSSRMQMGNVMQPDGNIQMDPLSSQERSGVKTDDVRNNNTKWTGQRNGVEKEGRASERRERKESWNLEPSRADV